MYFEADDRLHFGGQVVEAFEDQVVKAWAEKFPRQRGAQDVRHWHGIEGSMTKANRHH